MPFKLQILKTLILYVSKPYVRGVDKLMSTINQNTQMTQPWELSGHFLVMLDDDD